jgi:hypothetical protein
MHELAEEGRGIRGGFEMNESEQQGIAKGAAQDTSNIE